MHRLFLHRIEVARRQESSSRSVVQLATSAAHLGSSSPREGWWMVVWVHGWANIFCAVLSW